MKKRTFAAICAAFDAALDERDRLDQEITLNRLRVQAELRARLAEATS